MATPLQLFCCGKAKKEQRNEIRKFKLFLIL